jgi:hypothetical protein
VALLASCRTVGMTVMWRLVAINWAVVQDGMVALTACPGATHTPRDLAQYPLVSAQVVDSSPVPLMAA